MFLLTYDGRKGYNQRIGKELWKSREVWCPRGSRDGCAEEVTIRLGFARGSVFDSREKEGQSRWDPQKDSYSEKGDTQFQGSRRWMSQGNKLKEDPAPPRGQILKDVPY